MLKDLFFIRTNKAYIGPIGDDIPSLIPIVVGLVIFFGTFTFTLNEFNQRTQSFAADRDTLIIANTLKGSNYVSNYDTFITACNSLRVRGLHYIAGIIEATEWQNIVAQASSDPTQLTEVVQHFYQMNNSSGTPLPLQCTLGEDEFSLELLQSKKYIVLAFPIALEQSQAVVPATLVVIAWRI